MALVEAKGMLLAATAGGYAVGAFNVTNLVQMKAVIETASRLGAPVIVQTSVTPSRFLGPEVVAAACRAMAQPAPIPVALQLDHCDEVEHCLRCAAVGYTSIMMDASQRPLAENVALTREVAEHCRRLGGVSVEGELGTVCGVEDQVRVSEDEAELCDPAQVVEFIEQTGVDMLAPAIGTAHGVYKTADPKVDTDRLARIAELVGGQGLAAPLVVHGGTGLKPEVVTALVAAGGAKYNVSTDLKHTLIDTAHAYIAAHRRQYDPGKVDAAVLAAIAGRVEYWINLLGSAGKA